MTIDPFSPLASQTSTVPAADESLDVAFTLRGLHSAFRSIQLTVLVILGAIFFGIGLASMAVAALAPPAGARGFLVVFGVAELSMGGLLLLMPAMRSIRTMRTLGVGGVVSLRLQATPEHLTIEDRRGRRVVRWEAIDEVFERHGHVVLLTDNEPLLVPIPADVRGGS